MKRFSLIAVLAVAVTTLIVTNARSQQGENAEERNLRNLRENTLRNNFSTCLNTWAQLKSNFAQAGAAVEPTATERELLKALDVYVAEGRLRQVEYQLNEIVRDHPDTVHAGKAKIALKALKFD